MEAPPNLNVFLKLFGSRGKSVAELEQMNGMHAGYIEELLLNNKDLPSNLVFELHQKYHEALSVFDYILIETGKEDDKYILAQLNLNRHEEGTDEWANTEIDLFLEKKEILSKELE